jgi:hypothetical protein
MMLDDGEMGGLVGGVVVGWREQEGKEGRTYPVLMRTLS